MPESLLTLSQAHPWLTSFWVLIIALLAGKIIDWTFGHILRNLTRRTESIIDDRLIETLRPPLFWSILLAGIYIAILPLKVEDTTIDTAYKVISTVGLGIWAYFGTKISQTFFDGIHSRMRHIKNGVHTDLLPFLEKLSNVAIFAVALLIILSLWGISVTPLLASAGVASVVVAFAAKDSVANIFGGFSVFLDRPYKTGDYVIIDDKYRGEVIEIGLRSTKIKTKDNILLTIPNAVLVTEAVVNETGIDPKLRVRVPVSIAYGTDLVKAEKVLLSIIKQHKEVLDHPRPKVRYRKFGESGIEAELMGMIANPANRGRIIHDLIKAIDKGFKKEKITIPFPQRDVHVYQNK